MNRMYKVILFILILTCFYQCEKVLEQDIYSSIEMETFYDSQSSAEAGITGCYNRFFNEGVYPQLICYFQASTDDIDQPTGWLFQFKELLLFLPS